MRICLTHWADLRAEVKARGLDHLVARSGQQAVDNVIAELQGGVDPKDTFDPLINANFAIIAQFLEGVEPGFRIAAFTAVECPLCELQPQQGGKTAADPARNWIEGSVDDQYHQALLLGLVQPPARA